MQPVTIILNGREVSGRPGMTILELAKQEGVYIPTLCHEPQLSSPGAACPSIGACRICIVEEERNGALLTSCTTFITPGMVIATASPRVLERRRTIVELILSSHPDACLVCDKGNRCQLRRIASELSIGPLSFQKIPQAATVKDANPFIKRDLSKCVLCAKCIRACQELVVEGAVDYFRRGFESKPATFGDTALEESTCTFCGTCLALCPTGALMEAEPVYRGTVATAIRSTCPFCSCGCSLYLEVKDGQMVRVTPDKEDPVSRGTLCVKGSFGCDFIHSPDRLTSPLVKVNGEFQEVSWDQAIETIAREFNRIKGEYGSDSLAVFGSSKCTNEENYLLQQFARRVLGTNNIDNGSRLYGTPGLYGPGETGGFSSPASPLSALEEAEVILVVGADPTTSAPLVGYTVKRTVKCREAKLILVDPRETRLSMFAELWLKPKVGTDAVLINALSRVIIEEDLLNKESVNNETADFAAFAEHLALCTPSHIEEVTGVPYQEVRRAAHLYAGAKRAAIIYGSGVTQQVNGTEAVKALSNLALLIGNRSVIYPLQRDRNAQGACDMGALPGFLPGYHPVTDPAARRKFEDHWGSLPGTAGLTVLEMLAQAKAGKIKGMYIVGENPVSSFPDAGFTRDALSSVDFLVVQDLFLTETAALASVVLPAASFAEKEGTFTGFDGRINRLRKALEPPGQSLPDWEILLRLAAGMGHPMPYTSPQQVRKEIEKLVPLYREVGYGTLEEPAAGAEAPGGATQPFPTYRKQPDSVPRFLPVQNGAPPKEVSGEYPFVLLAGSNLYHFGGGTRSSRAPRLRKFSFEAFISIGEADAARLAVGEGDKVKVISAAGEMTATATITETLPEGVLFIPFSVSGNPVSQLFSMTLDPERKSPFTKAVNVRIERIGSNG